MKKLMKTLIILIPAVLLLMIGIFILQTRNSIVDKTGMINTREHELVSVEYYTGGGMDGGSFSMTLHKDEQGNLNYTLESQTAPGQDVVEYSAKATEEDFNRIKAICAETQALILGELEPDPLASMVLDAPSSHITFILENNKFINLSSNDIYPDYAKTLFTDIYGALITLAPEEFRENE